MASATKRCPSQTRHSKGRYPLEVHELNYKGAALVFALIKRDALKARKIAQRVVCRTVKV